jgi:CheY-like chemotaxis protein
MMLLKDKNIFVVEDNLQNRVVFQMSLMRHGATVNFERWGRDTLFRIKNTSGVDLIALDLMLADGITGFDLYDEIRAMAQFDAVPVIAVSAMDAAVAVPKVRSRGFNAFIAKPIDTYQFPKQIASVLAGEQVWDFGGSTPA